MSTLQSALTSAITDYRASMSRESLSSALLQRRDVQHIIAKVNAVDINIKEYNALAKRTHKCPQGNALYSYELFRAMQRRNELMHDLDIIARVYRAGIDVATHARKHEVQRVPRYPKYYAVNQLIARVN